MMDRNIQPLEQSKLADMNEDGIADSKDAASVLKYAAEK